MQSLFLENTKFSLKRLCFFLSTPFIFTSCLFPVKGFDKIKQPPPPDYSLTENWAALPTKKDSADAVLPSVGIIDQQQDAKVDVFFIHPTTFAISGKWNANLKKKRVNKRTDELPIRFQASVFNGSCKVYAPRYRQANLVTYVEKRGNAIRVFDLAYNDVKAAFLYYLKNYNNGRAFIIASHSQGTDHAVTLLKEFFKDSILKKQLVAAYIVGRPIPKGSLKEIPLGDSATQIGCFMTWNAVPYGEKKLFRMDPGNIECTNPLTWRTDTLPASASLNEGSVPASFKKIDIGLADAKITKEGLLWVHRPAKKSSEYMYIKSQSFHVLEYNLFYMNIRENIKQRIDAYFKQKK